jgi:hypothetical protein
MRARRGSDRSVVTGGHAKSGAAMVLVLFAAIGTTGAFFPSTLEQLGVVAAVVVGGALVGAGAGYRVVLERARTVVWKTWLGIPWRRRVYGPKAEPSVYWAFEDREPSGVVMVNDGRDDGSEVWWIFGGEKAAYALKQLIETELAWVRATKDRL